MSGLLDTVYSRNTTLAPHYEERLWVTLSNIWRQKLLVMATVAAALAAGVALALAMPIQYTAEAYVRGGFTPEEAVASGVQRGAVIALDASFLVETRSRMLESQYLAHRVVKRLGFEQIRLVVSEGPFSSWLRAKYYGDVTTTPEFQEGQAAKKLLIGLSVNTEPRVYLIVVRYTAGDPELAALIANAFVVEFIQITTLQALSHQRDLAQGALAEQLATLGEKHPKVIRARVDLQAANALLKAQLSKTPEEIARAGGGDVTFAQAITVPSSPNPPILIGIAMLVGLVGGIAIAAVRGRSQPDASTSAKQRGSTAVNSSN